MITLFIIFIFKCMKISSLNEEYDDEVMKYFYSEKCNSKE